MKKSYDSYQRMIEEIEEYAILLLDEHANVKNWNKGAEKIKGYKPDEIIGKNFRVFYTAEDQEKGLPDALINEAIAKGKAVHEGWRVRKDGSRFWGNILITALYDNKNNVTGFTKVTHDLTERKLAEEKLRKFNAELEQKVKERTDELLNSEKKYRLLFANNPMPMWVFDLATFKFLDVNNIAIVQYGYSREEFMSISVYDIRPDEQKELFRAADHSQSILPENYNRGIWKHRKKDGTVIDVEIFGHDLVFEGKNARLILANDITERKLAEEKLAGSEHRFRALVENTFDAISLHDEKGNVLYQSPATDKIIGYSLEETNGKDAVSFFHPDDIPNVMARMEAAFKNPGKPIPGVNRMRHKDGHYIWTEGSTTNLLHDKNVKALVGNFRDITERKVAEEKLMRANRLYAFLSQINQCLVHSNDEQTVYREACRIAIDFGKFKTAWIGLFDPAEKKVNIVEQIGLQPDEIHMFTNATIESYLSLNHIFHSGTSYLNNDIVKAVKGTRWEVFVANHEMRSCMVLPIRKSGNIVGVFQLYATEINFFNKEEIALLEEAVGDISFALDIFEKEKIRKLTEENLQISELKYRSLIEQASDAILVTDENGNHFDVNTSACNLLGYSRDTFFDLHIDDLMFEEDAFDHPAWNAELKSGREIRNEQRLKRKNGTAVYVELNAKMISDGRNLIFIRDITEKKVAEQEREFDRNNLKALINNTSDLMWSVDRNMKLITSNLAFQEVVKYLSGREMLKGNDIFDTGTNERLWEHYKKYYDRSFSGEIFTELEYAETPHPVWTEVSFHPIDDGNSVVGAACFAHDITKQKLAETERIKMIADIAQRNKELEEFSYIVSHNLRAPVANIIGLSEILDLADTSENDKKEFMGDLLYSVKKLDEVIKDINYVLHIKQGMDEKKNNIKFAELLNDIKFSIHNLISNESVDIISDFSEVDEMLTIKSYLYSIFFNLVSNSIKYRQPDIKPIIEIKSIKSGKKIVLTFKDNGLGIDLKKRGDQVFGLYRRFHPHVEGKGVGLYMVKTQVETLGGKISIASEVNKGTQFTIEFEINE